MIHVMKSNHADAFIDFDINHNTNFFPSKQHFCKQRQAGIELAKNQGNAKKHPVAELLLYENYSHSLSTLSSKNSRTYSNI